MNCITITNERNATYETIEFPNEKLKDKFLKKIYLNNSEIPVNTSAEQLEQITKRVLYVGVSNTYITLGVSKRSLSAIIEAYNPRDFNGTVELIVELDNIPLIFRRSDYAKIYNIKVSPQNVLFLDKNSIDEEDIEEMRRCAFAHKVEAVAREMFED